MLHSKLIKDKLLSFFFLFPKEEKQQQQKNT